jgi:hypothetical protein
METWQARQQNVPEMGEAIVRRSSMRSLARGQAGEISGAGLTPNDYVSGSSFLELSLYSVECYGNFG